MALPSSVAALQGARWLANLPLAYVSGHLVERAFGMTKRGSGGWLAEHAKAGVLDLFTRVPLMTGAFVLIRRRPDDWWLVLSGIAVPIALLATRLGPVLIAPIFNRFEALDDPELVGRIMALGDRAGVPIADVYRMNLSQQTERANAFFTGIGGAKRIVLGDTLLDRFPAEEIEGVVAHELGHQVHGDIWRLIGLLGVMGFTMAYGLFRFMPWVVRQSANNTGVHDAASVAALPLYSLVLTGAGIVLQPLQAAMSRWIERRTDEYALELTGDGAAYANAMERLAVQNLDEPDPPRWLVWYAYTHPPTSERIAAARSFGSRSPAV